MVLTMPVFERNSIFHGDVREALRSVPAETFQTVVTSFPYWALRDYKIEPSVWGGDPDHHHEWLDELPGDRREGQRGSSSILAGRKVATEQVAARISTRGRFCKCGAWLGCFGLEPNPDLYVQNAVSVAEEIKRTLRKDGTFWLNLGDCYISNPKTLSWIDPKYPDGRHYIDGANRGRIAGLKNKDLVGIPWRTALALQAAGWYLRADIIWHKLNPMPGSQSDRPTTAHEYIFLLSRSKEYFYDARAIAEPAITTDAQPVSGWASDGKHTPIEWAVGKDLPSGQESIRKFRSDVRKRKSDFSGENGRHDSATNSEAERRDTPGSTFNNNKKNRPVTLLRTKRSVWTVASQPFAEAHFATFPEKLIEPCILAGSRPGDIVADPFFGSGTTGVVCKKFDRDYWGSDKSAEYIEMAKRRIAGVEREVNQTLIPVSLVSYKPIDPMLFPEMEPEPETFCWNGKEFSDSRKEAGAI